MSSCHKCDLTKGPRVCMEGISFRPTRQHTEIDQLLVPCLPNVCMHMYNVTSTTTALNMEIDVSMEPDDMYLFTEATDVVSETGHDSTGNVP